VDEGDVILWVLLPGSAAGRLDVRGERSAAKVALWEFSWSSPGDGSDWRYGEGSVEVVALTRTRAHVRVNVSFPGGGTVSGELVAPIRE
jgi:hypothetical protein